MISLAKNKKGFAEGSHSVGHRALFVKFLCIILCIITCIGVPSTAYAKITQVTKVDILVYDDNNPSSTVPDCEANNVTVPYYAKTNYKQTEYDWYRVDQVGYIELNDGDIVTITLGFNQGNPSRYTSWGVSDFSIITYDENGNFYYLDEHYDHEGVYNSKTSTFTYTTTVKNVRGKCRIFWEGKDPKLTSYDPSVTLAFGVTEFSVDVKSEQSGFFDKVSDFFQGLFDRLTAWFNTLFEWLRDIRDNAVQLGNNLKSWFSDLSNNIKGWFTDLSNNIKGFFTDLTNNIKEQFTNMINNLKTFFADVGQWFKEIGDRIGDFFTNLWNNISNTINGITESVRNWWQGVIDFFHSLFVPEDGYFDKYKQDWEDWARLHFALFYDVMDIANYLFSAFPDGLNDLEHLEITIPEIRLPVLDKFVFIEETSIELGGLYNSHSSFKYFFNLYRICFSAGCYFLLIKYLQRTLSEVIAGDGDTL